METWDELRQDWVRQPHILDQRPWRPWSMMELRRSYHNVKYLGNLSFVDASSMMTPEYWITLKNWACVNVRVCFTTSSNKLTDQVKAWLLRDVIKKLSLKALPQDRNPVYLGYRLTKTRRRTKFLLLFAWPRMRHSWESSLVVLFRGRKLISRLPLRTERVKVYGPQLLPERNNCSLIESPILGTGLVTRISECECFTPLIPSWK